MPYTFKLNKESLKREFSIYIVIIKQGEKFKLYVGKTGDNRKGCNPVISRCGNHFSYNKIHSQIRNQIANHEDCEYTYVFDHFGKYLESDSECERRNKIDEINEMERWLNKEVQNEVQNIKNVEVVNPYKGNGHLSSKEKDKRKGFHTKDNKQKIAGIVDQIIKKIGEK